MRKITAILLTIAMALALTACGGDEPSGGTTTTTNRNNNATTTPVTTTAATTQSAADQPPEQNTETEEADHWVQVPQLIKNIVGDRVPVMLHNMLFTLVEVEFEADGSVLQSVTNTGDSPIWEIYWSGNINSINSAIIQPGDRRGSLGFDTYRLLLPYETVENYRVLQQSTGIYQFFAFFQAPKKNGIFAFKECVETGEKRPTTLNSAREDSVPSLAYRSDFGLHNSEIQNGTHRAHLYIIDNFTDPYIIWADFNDEDATIIFKDTVEVEVVRVWGGRRTPRSTRHTTRISGRVWSSASEEVGSNDAIEFNVFSRETGELVAVYTENFFSEYIPYDWGDSVAIDSVTLH